MSFYKQQPISTPQPAKPARLGKPRAALIVHRQFMGQPHFLLISSRRDPDRLTLPGGKVTRSESAIQTATREAREEAGVRIDACLELGSYLHHKFNGRAHPTQTFLARFAGWHVGREPRDLHWLTVQQIAERSELIPPPIREQLLLAAEALPAYIAAA